MIAILCIVPLSSAQGVETGKQPEAAQTNTAEPIPAKPSHIATDLDISTDSSGEKTINNPAEMHHPPGNLGGSYALNTPARTGFWTALIFTGLIVFAFIASLIFFKKGKVQ